jgi:hypothetical protein
MRRACFSSTGISSYLLYNSPFVIGWGGYFAHSTSPAAWKDAFWPRAAPRRIPSPDPGRIAHNPFGPAPSAPVTLISPRGFHAPSAFRAQRRLGCLLLCQNEQVDLLQVKGALPYCTVDLHNVPRNQPAHNIPKAFGGLKGGAGHCSLVLPKGEEEVPSFDGSRHIRYRSPQAVALVLEQLSHLSLQDVGIRPLIGLV